MELRRVIWAWESVVERLAAREPDFGRILRRSCRPIAAERLADGRLVLALGCWWAPDLAALDDPATRDRVDAALSELLEDQVRVELAPWPGGMATAPNGASDELPPPEILKGLPPEAREEAAKCESPVQRLFFARAWARGLRPRCQHPVLTYRLDFALVREQVAAEVEGWRRPVGRTGGREREQQLGGSGWRVIRFSAAEVLADPERCVAAFARLQATGRTH